MDQPAPKDINGAELELGLSKECKYCKRSLGIVNACSAGLVYSVDVWTAISQFTCKGARWKSVTTEEAVPGLWLKSQCQVCDWRVSARSVTEKSVPALRLKSQCQVYDWRVSARSMIMQFVSSMCSKFARVALLDREWRNMMNEC